jgi:hypothetical protein
VSGDPYIGVPANAGEHKKEAAPKISDAHNALIVVFISFFLDVVELISIHSDKPITSALRLAAELERFNRSCSCC